MIEKYNRPILFYALSIIIPWALWFVTAYVSHLEPTTFYRITRDVLGIAGLISPMIVAFALMIPDKDLRRDLKMKLFHFRNTKTIYLILTCTLMLASILAAQAVSLLFGYSPTQFTFAEQASFQGGVFSAAFFLIIAPIFEELAWHSYGTDCLRRRFTLFTLSMIFAVFWAFWHFPLSLVKDYYQNQVAETGALYSINFIVSLFPFVILMNWLYFKTNRNILVVIVFHFTAGYFNEIFQTHPMSKVIQTGLLILLSVVILIKDREMFFKLDYEE
ncbi:MAG TPA: CPBP family intramembrane glutamic endopeptidase [Virgibacillus sp.]|nr:CPBP family intramembrane glutamic endopeptidase [Virgibacillus sp.]